jgi:sulfotransferase
MAMKNGIHFISGLPRSGSTLLAALLRQNPRFSAGMTSAVGSLFTTMLRETSQRNEAAVFIDDFIRARLLRGVFQAYYAEVDPKCIVFDTNRVWCSRLPTLVRLFPEAKMICCVRNLAWIMDSVECLVRRNAFEVSGIFGFEPNGTVYSRVEGLAAAAGMVGFAFNALREAVYGEHANRLLLVRYESLLADPLATLRAIYDYIGEPWFKHDPQHIEPSYDMIEFDNRMGTPGLHEVRNAVRARERRTILPPDIFARYEKDAFWDDPAKLPDAVRLI